jgi:hypothetical protein
VFEHLFGDVTGNIHDGLIPGTALGKIGYQRVPVVVPAALNLGVLAHVIPCRLERGDRARWVARTRFPEGEGRYVLAAEKEALPRPNLELWEQPVVPSSR